MAIYNNVSIPRSEFWSFGPVRNSQAGLWTSTFQFLGRNSGRSDAHAARQFPLAIASFNSSVGILVVRTPIPLNAWVYKWNCFNSSVGILVVRTKCGPSV